MYANKTLQMKNVDKFNNFDLVWVCNDLLFSIRIHFVFQNAFEPIYFYLFSVSMIMYTILEMNHLNILRLGEQSGSSTQDYPIHVFFDQLHHSSSWQTEGRSIMSSK